jgi:hypothetical protein
LLLFVFIAQVGLRFKHRSSEKIAMINQANNEPVKPFEIAHCPNRGPSI